MLVLARWTLNAWATGGPRGARDAGPRVPLVRAALISALLPLATGELNAQERQVEGPIIYDRQTPLVFEGDLRELPTRRGAQPGDSLREFPDMRVDQPGRRQGPEGIRLNGELLGPPVTMAAASSPVSFDGIGAAICFPPNIVCVPPDVVGDIGPNHYVQAVNILFAVYDRQGNLLVGPAPINALWAGSGGACEANNNGDPIVRYDHLADRWLISQFAIAAGFECIAISRTSDPVAGGWYLYSFPTPGTPDYPKIGVWPDGYYMGTQRGFPNSGLDVYAFERVRMLNGLPAGQIQFQVPGSIALSIA